MDEYLFEIKNHLSELTRLGDRLAGFGRLSGLPRKCIFEINLCLDELLTNIISYGFTDTREHFIKISIIRHESVLILHIEDDGIPFNPEKLEKPRLSPNIENRKVGGLGVYFIKELVDDIRYQRRDGKNKLTLKKIIPVQESASPLPPSGGANPNPHGSCRLYPSGK